MGAPHYLTPIRGRDSVLHDLLATFVRPGVGTLWGPGGAGKTRLAGEAVRRLRRERRPVWFVSVPERAGVDQLTAAVLTGLEVPDTFGREVSPAERISRWLVRHESPVL